MEYDMAAAAFERIAARAAEVDLIARMGGIGEGPAWNRRTGEIYWVSIVGNTIWKWKRGVGLAVVMRPSIQPR